MIPTLIQRRGAQHLAEEEALSARDDAPAKAPALNPPRAVLELMPESVARENMVLPMSQDNGALKIIMSDPSDFDTVQKLQFILNKDIQPVLAPREQIVEAINRHYGQSETESVDSMLQEFTDTAIDFNEAAASSGMAAVISCLVHGLRPEIVMP